MIEIRFPQAEEIDTGYRKIDRGDRYMGGRSREV
jgi:hypothetical protein